MVAVNAPHHTVSPIATVETACVQLVPGVHPRKPYWKIFAAVFIAVAVAVNAWSGAVVWELFGVLPMTLYGVVVITRKLLQLGFARRGNAAARRVVRQPIVESLAAAHPGLHGALNHLLERPLQLDDFKAAVYALLEPVYHDEVRAALAGKDKRETLPITLMSKWIEQQWYVAMQRSFGARPPSVGVVVPTYKTSLVEMRRLVDSLEAQTYPRIAIVIVLNEHNEEMIQLTDRLRKRYGEMRYVREVEPRKGKRNAMYMGFRSLLDADRPPKYIFNVDSDSMLHPDAISNAVRYLETFPDVACVTGDIRITNPNVNLLTKLTYQRFFFSFHVERAAQNLFHAVTCMSGAFFGVRSDLLREVAELWANQTFLGQHCTYGDDRHISTLALQRGLGAAFSPDCISWTDVPEKLKVWRRQQTRWLRSAWRETIITLPWLYRLPLWTIFEITYQVVFPFILWGILIALGYRAVQHGPAILLPYLAVTVALSLIFHSIYGGLIQRDRQYVLYPLYLFFQFVHLQPLRLWALMSLDETTWGTK